MASARNARRAAIADFDSSDLGRDRRRGYEDDEEGGGADTAAEDFDIPFVPVRVDFDEPGESAERSYSISFRPSSEFLLSQDPLFLLQQLRMLGTLQAKIGAAYLFYWIRGWFKRAEARERLLAETHWQTAVSLFDSMSYLRGAVMKVGQTLANFPDILRATRGCKR